MATQIGYSVPEESIGFWQEHFERHKVFYSKPSTKFGELSLAFVDPDGLHLEIVASQSEATRKPWATKEVSNEVATRGFHHVTLTLANIEATVELLTNGFSYKLMGQEGNRFRLATDAVNQAAIVDLVELPGVKPGLVAGRSVHHLAFRVKDQAVQQKFRDQIVARGWSIT